MHSTHFIYGYMVSDVNIDLPGIICRLGRQLSSGITESLYFFFWGGAYLHLGGGARGRHHNDGCTMKSQMGRGQWCEWAMAPAPGPHSYATAVILCVCLCFQNEVFTIRKQAPCVPVRSPDTRLSTFSIGKVPVCSVSL